MFGYMNNMIGLFGALRETGLGKGLEAEGGTSGIAGKVGQVKNHDNGKDFIHEQEQYILLCFLDI